MKESQLFTHSQYDFVQSQAYARLKALAQNPFDLTNPQEFTPKRLQQMRSQACGFKLLYGTSRVTSEVIKALDDLAKEAQLLKKMQAQQDGQVINYIEGYESEERKALHTALRDFFDHPRQSQAAMQAAELAKREYHKLEELHQELSKENYTDLIFIGIGGSELGPKTLYYGLQGWAQPKRRVHFISNVDPDDAAQVLRQVELKSTLVVVVSKSGSTLETQTNENLLRHYFLAQGLKPQKQFLAVTGKSSPMDNLSRYRRCLYIWDWVGGRFCSTSMVGGIVLSFAYGISVYHKLLEGAHAMDLVALEEDLHTNLPLLLALLAVWNRNFLEFPTLAIVPYSQVLIRFAAHIQQVEMESNGKRIDRQGEALSFHSAPVIWGEPATNAQHSFFQLLHQGTDVVPVEFIGFEKSQLHVDLEQQGTTSQEKLLANLFAQALALATGQKHPNPNKVFPGNRPSTILLGEQVTPYTLGALLALYEHKVAFEGFIWNINSFDQSGVELGKVLANNILESISSRKQGIKQVSYPLGDALLDQLNIF